MNVLLIIVAVIVGLPVYGILGFLVFVALERVTKGDWKTDWRSDEGLALMFMLLWPAAVAMAVIALPWHGIYLLSKKLMGRGE